MPNYKILKLKKMINFGSSYFKVAMTDFPNSFSDIIAIFAQQPIKIELEHLIRKNKFHLKTRTVSIFKKSAFFSKSIWETKMVIFY